MPMHRMNDSRSKHIPKILVICDRSDTAPLWGYVLRQVGVIAVLETNIEKALQRWSEEMPELVVIDMDVTKQDPLEFCKTFRTISVAPILLFLPLYNETQIIEAYATGVDDVLVKSVSHTIFIPKIMAWLRRTWIMPTDGLNLLKAGKLRLDPELRCAVTSNDLKIRLTNLEFRLLMSCPGQIFMADEIIQSIWGGYGTGDHVLLKNVVYRLRKKIEQDPANPVMLKTVEGGYSFQG